MVKNSFTLFEVLLSLILFALVLAIVLNIFTSNDTIDTYYKLQNQENKYNESNIIEQSEEIGFKINL